MNTAQIEKSKSLLGNSAVEMLLQSHVPVGEKSTTPRFIIHLLPALPAAWPSGSVKGLRARGGLSVDLEWKEGKLAGAALTPSQSGPIEVRLGEKTTTLQGEAGKPLQIDGSLR